MEDRVKSELGTGIFKKVGTASGCINVGGIYDTDKGRVFVKRNSTSEASDMFRGEFESLKELAKTGTVKVPRPLFVGNVGREFFIVMEYVDVRSLSKYSSELGNSLGRMHEHNVKALRSKEGFIGCDKVAVDKFGFHVTTACGSLPQNNEWHGDWVEFYARQKLQPQVDMVLKNDGNRQVQELWSHLQLKIPSFFTNICVEPSLLHGDLWIGNSGETNEGPVIFDPASFYGHNEYDLAIAAMFGGFGKSFFDSYHKVIPKADGFYQRHQLYLLFHHLNHWNHFGSHRESSLRIMKKLIQ